MIKLAFRPIENNGTLYFTQKWDAEISQKFKHKFNCYKVDFFFQIKNIK